ncbi:MAG: TMEM165/GDT1 family protein [Clostridia bacterium]|nr:TMEM165/GDT1 family protein [Clostridia bacterium]
MIASDAIAILFGKWLNHMLPPKTMHLLSGGLFLLFGIYGLISFFINL